MNTITCHHELHNFGRKPLRQYHLACPKFFELFKKNKKSFFITRNFENKYLCKQSLILKTYTYSAASF